MGAICYGQITQRHLSESQKPSKWKNGWRDNGGGVLRFCGMMMKREKGDENRRCHKTNVKKVSVQTYGRDNTRELIMQFLIRCYVQHSNAAAVTKRRYAVSCVCTHSTYGNLS